MPLHRLCRAWRSKSCRKKKGKKNYLYTTRRGSRISCIGQHPRCPPVASTHVVRDALQLRGPGPIALLQGLRVGVGALSLHPPASSSSSSASTACERCRSAHSRGRGRTPTAPPPPPCIVGMGACSRHLDRQRRRHCRRRTVHHHSPRLTLDPSALRAGPVAPFLPSPSSGGLRL